MQRSTRAAAVISTAIAVPVAVLLALGLSSGRNPKSTSASSTAVLPAVSAPALAPNPAADSGCAKVFAQLPVQLNGLSPRTVHSTSTFIAAWGQPPVIFKCGVGRPDGLSPGSADFVQDISTPSKRSAEWLPVRGKDTTVWTSIDRAVYVEVTVPNSYQGADLVTLLTDSLAAALPAVCQAQPQPYPSNPDPALVKSLCVNRK